jgi:predicted amidohydrolase YtcJ
MRSVFERKGTGMRLHGFILFIAAFFCTALNGSAQTDNPAERIFYNAKIFTAEPKHPYAEAVAIRGDKIIAVGSHADATKAVGRGAESIDLHGKRLLPGLIDSHVHPILGGFILSSPDAGDDKVRSVADLAVVVTEAAKNGRGMHGDIFMISRIPLPIWSKTDELNKLFSTGAFENLPIFLWGADGHTGWANRVLRLRVGLTKDFISHLSEDERTYYGVTPDLEPNGLGVDAGLGKIVAALPHQTREERLAWGRSAVHYLNSLGITAWLDARADPGSLTAYRDLSEHGELTAHVAAFPEVKATKETTGDPLAKVQALREQFRDVVNLTIPGIKIFADGVVEYPSQTAAMSAPYKNTGKYGELLFDPEAFAHVVTAADKLGLVVHIHAIGDKAVTESLNGIEAARKVNGNSGLPHTIAHLQFVNPSDFPRFRQLGVIADLQLLWACANVEAIELVKPYIDPAVYVSQYPSRSLLNAGATISGGSDWYVSSPNVFLAIYQAETRQGPEGILNARERMPRKAMLYAYTRNAALAMNQLDEIGSIAPGKQADFVVLDRDVLTVPVQELKNTKVLWTILGGKTIFGSKP